MAVPGAAGVHLKPLRASGESGMWSAVLKIKAGAGLPTSSCLGGMDLFVLSGEIGYAEGGAESTLEPGTWGYIPANTRIDSMSAQGDSEFLANFYSALAFLGPDGSVGSVLTSADIGRLAMDHGITLVPNTLAECMRGTGGPVRRRGRAPGDRVRERQPTRRRPSGRRTAIHGSSTRTSWIRGPWSG